MRISDWSSDVCSSDLADERRDPEEAEAGAVEMRRTRLGRRGGQCPAQRRQQSDQRDEPPPHHALPTECSCLLSRAADTGTIGRGTIDIAPDPAEPREGGGVCRKPPVPPSVRDWYC